MSLTKRTRFILVKSTNNANVTEDNMEPYHISIFRRSTSMPPLPRLSSSHQRRQSIQQTTATTTDEIVPTSLISKSHRREKSDILTNKFNIHAMKRKSVRFSRRLSSAFGFTAQTIDEQFNFHEQRFRALEKFFKIFLRNTYTSVETLRESFLSGVDIAEHFGELLIDQMPDISQQFLRLQRSLLENTFTEFCNHIETNVISSINNLLKLFLTPANLISKRHKKLLDYDSAQSSYEKVKDQQLIQAKQVLDISKRTYEELNNQLLEELPILYQCSCQILDICLKEFLYAYFRLMQQMRLNIRLVFHQTIEQMNWSKILERFPRNEQLFRLTITAKNFSEKLKTISIIQNNNLYNYDKETELQNEDIRSLLKNRYSENDLFFVTQNVINSRSELTFRQGDLVGIIHQHNNESNCLVDNGILRGYLSRSILISFISDSHPVTPIRHDLSVPSRAPQPLPRTRIQRNSEQISSTIEEGHIRYSEDIEPIYSNEFDSHSYASIDPDHSISSQSNENEQIYIALYDFNCPMEGVLSLTVGERLKILRQVDDDGNDEWWYVEKLNQTGEKGYVPANYIQAI